MLSQNNILYIKTAQDDSGDVVGFWVTTQGGSVYLPKKLIEECMELTQ